MGALGAHGIAAMVTLGVWLVLPIIAWTLSYLALFALAAVAGGGMGSPLTLPIGLALLGVAGGIAASIVCAIGCAGDIVQRGLGLPIGATPLAIGGISAAVSFTAALAGGRSVSGSVSEALVVALLVLIGSVSYWGPLLAVRASARWARMQWRAQRAR